ncbi:unnamed protein product, partial [Rotaria magnacalcarata]
MLVIVRPLVVHRLLPPLHIRIDSIDDYDHHYHQHIV